MSMTGKMALLADRGVVSVTGADARAFLDNMITNDMGMFDQGWSGIFAGLLTPQGKILFEFFVVKANDGYLLDTQRDKAADLAKRLAMYKLRSKVEVTDVSDAFQIFAHWPRNDSQVSQAPAGSVVYVDSRDQDIGLRSCVMIPEQLRPSSTMLIKRNDPWGDYDAHRIALGIPEGGKDYPLGDTFPHEANWDRMQGVSFTKGCYVGQEVVARMQNKAVVRKRVVRIAGERLTIGADILHGSGVIGRIGTVAGGQALAMLRLDRAAEAEDKDEPLLADGAVIVVDEKALADYRKAVANRPVIDL